MDPNNSKTVPRENTPPPPYDEGPGIYPAGFVYSNDYTTQHQNFAPECIIESSTYFTNFLNVNNDENRLERKMKKYYIITKYRPNNNVGNNF